MRLLIRTIKVILVGTLLFSLHAQASGFASIDDDNSNRVKQWYHCNQEIRNKMIKRLKNWKDSRKIPRDSVLVVLAGGFSRVCEAVNFYRRHKPLNIIVTGWPDQVEVMTQTLLKEGVPSDIIIKEVESKNTRDHVWFVNKIIHNRYPVRPHISLITDRWHMQRSQDYFSAYGFPVDSIVGSDPTRVAFKDKCYDQKPELIEDPFSFVEKEAANYANVGLCYGLWPEYRNNRNYNQIAMKLTLTAAEFVDRCKKVARDSNLRTSKYQIDPTFCDEVIATLQNPDRTYEEPVTCLTEAKVQGLSQSTTNNLCRNSVRKGFFLRSNTVIIPSQYVFH